MKSIKSNKFLILSILLSLLVMMVAGLFFWKGEDKKDESENLTDSNVVQQEEIYEYSWKMPKYDDLSMENLKLADVDGGFSIKNGKVYHDGSEVDISNENSKRALKVALFYQILREDPILVNSTLNKDALLKSLEDLKKEENRVMERDGIVNNIYPIEFLESLVKTSDKYNKISEYSEESANDLVEDMRNVLDLYMRSISRFEAGLESLKQTPHSEKKIAYLGGETYTSLRIMLEDLELMKENSRALQNEFKQLEKCLKEDINYCKRNLLETEKPKSVSSSLQSEKKVLPEKSELFLDLSKDYRGAYEINSSCWQRKEKQYLYLFTECIANYCKDIADLADNAYFAKTIGITKLDREFQDKGVEIVPQRATTPYACNNLEYKASILTLDNFYVKYKNNRIFKMIKASAVRENVSQDFLNELQNAESLFFDAKIPSEDSLDALREWYVYVYGVIVNENVDEEKIKNELLIRINLLNGKMHHLERIFNGTVKNLAKHNINTSNMRIIPIYVFSVRSNYSLFYLNFSSVIWRLQSHPQYMEHEDTDSTSENTGNIFDYRQAMSIYGKEKIISWSQKYIELSKEFYEEFYE